MRSLFYRQEQNTDAAADLPALDIPEGAPRQREASPLATTEANVGGIADDGRRRRFPTTRQHTCCNRRLAIVAIVASLGIVCRWHVANLEPTYPVGEGVYQQNRIPDSSVSRQPSAALFYMAAADAFHVDIPQSVTNGSTGLIDEPLSTQKPVVAQAQPAFVLLRQGMRCEFTPDRSRGYFMTEPSSIGGPIQPRNFAPIREMSRLLVVESRVKEAEGDTFGALQSSLDAMRLGTDCAQGGSLLDGMVGTLSQSIGAREAMRHVDGLSATEARAGTARLEKMLENERSIAQIMTDERDTMTYAMLQSVFRTGTLKGVNESTGDEIDLKGAPWRFALGAWIFARSKQGIVNDFAEQHDRILTRMKMPYQLSRRLYVVPPSENTVVRYWIGDSFERASFQCVRQSTQNRVLLTQLAIQAYRREHGGIAPSSLGELTAGQKPYLGSVPTDPFSLTGRCALRYSPSTGIAYSVGNNGTDDKNSGDDNCDL